MVERGPETADRSAVQFRQRPVPGRHYFEWLRPIPENSSTRHPPVIASWKRQGIKPVDVSDEVVESLVGKAVRLLS